MDVQSAGCSPVFTVGVVLLLLSFQWSCVQSACLSSCPSNACSSQHNPNQWYCASPYYVQTSSQQQYYISQPYLEYYTTICTRGWNIWARCTQSRVKYNQAIQYHAIYHSSLRCSFSCCDGYSGSGTNCQPVCAQPCHNGGTCSNPNTCTCTSQWSGSTCTTPVCVPACMNGGTCSSPGVCMCTSDWSGVRCGDPVCNPSCSHGGTCIAPNTCSCVSQWTGPTCATDVDECTAGTDNCQQQCTNTPGGYNCGCNTGYELLANGYQCRDINECTEGTHDCSQTCSNTEGSFQCGCLAGYMLQGRTQCADIDECVDDPCDHTCTNNVGSFVCGCNEGYRLQGSTTCTDIDECTTGTNNCQQLCTNTPGFFTCGCNTGYRLLANGYQCQDVDECTTATHNCQQLCTNTPGGFICGCNTGYELLANGYECQDVDECTTGTHNCQQQCTNTPGSFTCGCNSGYRLLANGYHCQDVDECTAGTHNCQQLCTNTPGGFTCGCNTGYELLANGYECQDVDECGGGTHNCQQQCTNTLGSFTCGCNTGYRLLANGYQCQDVDECTTGTDSCQQQCTNTPGSFICGCNTGYHLLANGYECQDVDECSDGNHNCQQQCSNTPGSFICGCNTGYELLANGYECQDIDECTAGTHNCQQQCTNTPGSFTCGCNTGYELLANGYQCQDVDECTIGTHNCQQQCTNTPGSFICGCNTGYRLLANGYQCQDVDECTTGTHNCQQQCTNTPGSFTCGCNTGYCLLANGYQCQDINECTEGSHDCSQTCTNTVGSFQCGCLTGYRLQGRIQCADINECTEDTHDCSQMCSNTEGSFQCECLTGYRLQGRTQCVDVDECERGEYQCSQHCQNSVGSYYCYCNPGYVRTANGLDCEEFNLTTALNTPTEPANRQFLSTIYIGLRNCVPDICACLNTLFTTLSDLGYTQGTVNTTGDAFSIELSTEQQQATSDLILAIFGSDSTIVLPIVANIKEMVYNCSNHVLLVETLEAEGELEIFPDLLSISMITLRVSISSVTSSPKLDSLKLLGTFVFGSVSLDTFVEMIDPDIWTFGANFGEDAEINIIELISSAIGVDIPSEPFGSLLTITDISIKGLTDNTANKFLLVLQGTVHISSWYKENVCIIIHQSLGAVSKKQPGLGFISGCVGARSIKFSTVISAISGLNVSSFGFFGSFQLPKFHIIYTTPNFVIDDHHLSLIGYSNLEFALEDLDFSGFRFIFDFYNARTRTYSPWVFYRKFCPCIFRQIFRDLQDAFSLSDMMSTLSSVLILPSVELVNEDLSGIMISSMNLDLELKTLTLAIKVPEPITIFMDSFQISDLTISFEIALSRGISFNTFSLSGALILGASTFDASFLYNRGEYDLLACSEDFEAGFEGIANALGTSLESSIAVSDFSFDQIGLFSPCFAIKFRAGQYPEYMCFSADLYSGEFAEVGISACVTQGKRWVFGFEVREFVIAKLLTKIIGSAGRHISFFNQKLDVALIVASVPGNNLPLRGVLLDQVNNIRPGTTLVATSQWPEGCDSDSFCNVARSLIGEDLNIILIIHLVGRRVSVEARIENFKMGDFTLSAASIEMMFGGGSISVGIAAEMDISNPPITLIGAFRSKFPKVQISMEFAMRGCWDNAFGISILDMCDFFIAVSILPGSPLPGVAFGVRVKIGEERCFVLEATGFFGINPNDPTDNYFYVSVNELTFQRVIDLFCVGIQLPSFLGDTGFPEGFVTSYAAKPIYLKHASLTIPKGFYFKGAIIIFGLTIESEMTLDPPKLIDVYARLGPLTLGGGLLKMYESHSVTSRGPYLHVVVQSFPPVFKAEASGYVYVLGIEAEGILSVSKSGYKISVYGKIFGVLEAKMTVKASIGNVLDASFSVSGRISISILQRIQHAVVSFIHDTGKKADRKITDAQNRIRSAEVAFDNAVEKLNRAIKKLQDARWKINSHRRKIRSLHNKLCRDRSCRYFCAGCTRGCGCSKKWWGKCVWPCLKWNSCCSRFRDPICRLYNAGCAIRRGIVRIAISAAQVLLTLAEGVLRAAEGVVRGLQFLVNKARIVLNAAVAILEVVKRTVAIGLKALEVVTKFLLTGIINIREIGFDVQLALFSHGRISAYIDVSFFGQSPVRLSVSLPLFNPLALVHDLADRAIPGIGRKKRSIGKRVNKVFMLAEHFKHTGSIYPTRY